MKKLMLVGLVAASLLVGNVFGSKIPLGNYLQSSSNAGDSSSAEIEIIKLTPDIIKIDANNNWIGFAAYNAKNDKYEGIIQWKEGYGGAYEGILLYSTFVYEGQTLTLHTKSDRKGYGFNVTYRKK